ncbi:hypothetical protein FOA52_012628 [Chlamydomonas sp. UWO 241]|nr:hypothetical protein FOA52_012628 [Chlamydomonas sp. UWO 241]
MASASTATLAMFAVTSAIALIFIIGAMAAMTIAGLRAMAVNAIGARAQQWRACVRREAEAAAGREQMDAASLLACAQAGLRVMDAESSEPLVTKDGAAAALCGGAGYRLAKVFAQLQAEEAGSRGQPSTAAARARVLDDDASFALASMAREAPDARSLQVVCLGCATDTRPWRLRRGGASRGPGAPTLVWINVDTAGAIEDRTRRLADGGLPTSVQVATKGNASKHSAVGSSRGGRSVAPLALSVDELRSVACELEVLGALLPVLKQAGFDANAPTLWLMEGLLLSRLSAGRAAGLLRECVQASAPGSRLLATLLTQSVVDAATVMEKEVAAVSKAATQEAAVAAAAAPRSSGAAVAAAAATAAEAEATRLLPLFPLPIQAARCSTHDLLGPTGSSDALDSMGWSNMVLSQDLRAVVRQRYRVECAPAFSAFAAHGVLSRVTDVERVLSAVKA